MHNRTLPSLLLLLVLIVLGGCSDFDEMKSQRLWLDAQNLLRAGDEVRGEELLATLVTTYPRTRAAGQALQRLEQFRAEREREHQGYALVLDSFINVFSAYRSLYGHFPRSAEELGRADFLFDTPYLAEVTPSGYLTYLYFAGGEEGFRVWCLKEGAQRGYLADGLGKSLQRLSRAAIEAELAASFQPLRQLDNLTIVGRKP